MRTTHHEEAYIHKDPLTDRLFDEHAVFFDIETTGFSPANTSLYLIGCARRSGDLVLVDQFFAETPDEEGEVLNAFLESLADCDTLISYNGLGFDVPYLRAKCSSCGLQEPFGSFHYIDIFKSVSKYRFLLGLENYKQKSVEAFLGKTRDDQYNGGELIGVYLEYAQKPTDEGRRLLLLNNYEDVVGMIDLLPILS
jgi:hypothetical protein